jgi:hypothetical protein
MYNKEQKTAEENDAKQKSAQVAKQALKSQRTVEQAEVYKRKV